MSAQPAFIPGRVPMLSNCWYVVAYTGEVGHTPLSRTVVGQKLVLFRTQAGEIVILEDRCAHRAMALSLGLVKGDSIKCRYHGIEFGKGGFCTSIPSQDSIPSKMKVRAYRFLERWDFLWVWMGDADKADPALVPDHNEFGLMDPQTVKSGHYMVEIDGNYELLHENLLDVGHISHLHEGSIDSGQVVRTEPKVTVNGNRIRIERDLEEVASPGFAAFFEFKPGERISRHLRTDVWIPNLSVVTNIFRSLDRPELPERHWHSPFPITPSTGHSSYLFSTLVKDWGEPTEDPEFERMANQILAEDKLAIESAQSSYDALGADAPDVSVRADEAALRFRRLIGKLVQNAALNEPARAAGAPVI